MGEYNSADEYLKNCLRQDIYYYQNKLQEYIEAYDSLLRFKESVRAAHTAFESANGKKTLALNDLSAASINNTVVQKYKKNMGNQLSGIGNKTAGAAFWGLRASIDLKIGEYYSTIKWYEWEIYKKKTELRALEFIF